MRARLEGSNRLGPAFVMRSRTPSRGLDDSPVERRARRRRYSRSVRVSVKSLAAKGDAAASWEVKVRASQTRKQMVGACSFRRGGATNGNCGETVFCM